MSRIFKPDSGQALEIQDEGGSAALTVETDGDVTVDAGNLVIGTAGKGIDFSNQASPAAGMTSELLDSYEEGTWTPVYAFTTPGSSSITADANNGGTYTKVGNIVHINFFISADAVTVGSGSGNLTVTGLPFTVATPTGNESGTMSIGYTSKFTVVANYPQGIKVVGATTIMALYRYNATYGIQTSLEYTDLKDASNSSIIYASGSYNV